MGVYYYFYNQRTKTENTRNITGTSSPFVAKLNSLDPDFMEQMFESVLDNNIDWKPTDTVIAYPDDGMSPAIRYANGSVTYLHPFIDHKNHVVVWEENKVKAKKNKKKQEELKEIFSDKPMNSFRYSNCLEREYRTRPKNIERVFFNIDRDHEVSIDLGRLTSEKKAIREIESYLRQPLTKEYFERINTDNRYGSWKEAKVRYTHRSDFLFGHTYLEEVCVNNGVFSMEIGS